MANLFNHIHLGFREIRRRIFAKKLKELDDGFFEIKDKMFEETFKQTPFTKLLDQFDSTDVPDPEFKMFGEDT